LLLLCALAQYLHALARVCFPKHRSCCCSAPWRNTYAPWREEENTHPVATVMPHALAQVLFQKPILAFSRLPAISNSILLLFLHKTHNLQKILAANAWVASQEALV
jgi:hypothetical protein